MIAAYEQNPLPGKGIHILVVDDNTTFTEMLKDMLQMLGYEVTATADPREALIAFRREPQRFHG